MMITPHENQYKKSKPGFTLIELLVVIAIIGLLSSVVLASLNSARGKAQDARRLSDMHQLGLAIQLVADDNGGVYPSSGGVGACLGTSGSCWSGVYSGNASLNTALNKYLPTIPSDPAITSGEGDKYLYGDVNSAVAWHCSGPPNAYSSTVYPHGPYIAWVPAKGSAASDSDCKNATFYGCCPGGSCAPPNYFCVYQINPGS